MTLTALGKQLGHIFAGLFAALHIVGDDQADVFARPDADVGDDDRNVLGVEDRLDRLGDHHAVAGKDQNAVDLLRADVFEIGDLLGLVVVAAVGDDQVDVDALGLPLVDGFLGAVHHRDEEGIGSPKDGIADLVVFGAKLELRRR